MSKRKIVLALLLAVTVLLPGIYTVSQQEAAKYAEPRWRVDGEYAEPRWILTGEV